MRARSRFLWIIAFIAIVAILAAGGVWGIGRLKEKQRLALQSRLVPQLAFVIDLHMNENKSLDRRFGHSAASNWRPLDEGERHWLTNELAREQDISGDWKDSVLTDAWGNPIQIEVRRLTERPEFRVTSAGSDRRFGTVDDIVSTADLVSTQPPPARAGGD
jgi:hypothetical protein